MRLEPCVDDDPLGSSVVHKKDWSSGGMTMNDVESKTMEVFRSVLSLPAGVTNERLVYNEYPGWDSVAHMTIVAKLEESFDCMLDMQDILDMSSFQKAVSIMGKYSG